MTDRIEAIRDEQDFVVQPGRLVLSAEYIHSTDADEIADFITSWFRGQIAPGIKREQDRLRALAPVAPDAEPGEWEWAKGDVVQDPEDGTVVAREAGGTYPWRSTNGVDQRDQDITDLVTNHGGRVLICKARGMGSVSP